MKKIAETKLSNSFLTTVPKAVRLFLSLKENDKIGWYVDKNAEIKIIKEGEHEKEE